MSNVLTEVQFFLKKKNQPKVIEIFKYLKDSSTLNLDSLTGKPIEIMIHNLPLLIQ